MTIKELIRKLQTFDENITVLIEIDITNEYTLDHRQCETQLNRICFQHGYCVLYGCDA